MNAETKKILQTRFQELPPAIQEKILAIDLSSELSRIVETTLLQKEQLIALENEILFVFLGFDDVANLTTNIAHSTDITRERAEKFSRAIKQQILLPNAEIVDFALHKYADAAKKPNNASDDAAASIPNNSKENPRPMLKNDPPQMNTLPKKQTPPTPKAPPPKPTVPSQAMFAEKMEKEVHIPKDESVVEKKASAHIEPDQEPDPYRELPT